MKNRNRMAITMFCPLLITLAGCQGETPSQQPAPQAAVEQPSAQPATLPAAAPATATEPVAAAPAPAARPASSTVAVKKEPVAAQPAAPVAGSSSPFAKESGTAIKADDIRKEPFGDAAVAGRLATGDRVEILGREGGWYHVNSGKSSGWVRMLSIRKGDAARGGGSSGVLGLASGRAGTGKVVATTGIRGLNEEELKSATFNEAEVKLAESYASSRGDASAFATQGKLAARPFTYLAAPK